MNIVNKLIKVLWVDQENLDILQQEMIFLDSNLDIIFLNLLSYLDNN